MVESENPVSPSQQVAKLLLARGNSRYGAEAVSQREHALQTAYLAEQAGASSAQITAALLHDVGHLLHDLPDDAPEGGRDDLHEDRGAKWLRGIFGPDVVEPVAWHVAAKRYLCAVEADYYSRLSEPSRCSLRLQGGPMTKEEVEVFAARADSRAMIALRRWDDAAKTPYCPTPTLEHFLVYVERAAREYKP